MVQVLTVAIKAIQSHCKLYNYDIWQEAVQQEKLNRESWGLR